MYRLGCALFQFWNKSHVRRKYIDSSGKEIPGSKGAEAREWIDQLFYIERQIKELPPEEKLKQRQELSKKVLDAFWVWMEKTSALHTTNTKLTEALTYSSNQRKNLETFLRDGRVPLSNNRAESHIRSFAPHRRAWLFADTQAGARANAAAYSLIETARSYDLNVYEYLKHVLTRMPALDHHNITIQNGWKNWCRGQRHCLRNVIGRTIRKRILTWTRIQSRFD